MTDFVGHCSLWHDYSNGLTIAILSIAIIWALDWRRTPTRRSGNA